MKRKNKKRDIPAIARACADLLWALDEDTANWICDVFRMWGEALAGELSKEKPK